MNTTPRCALGRMIADDRAPAVVANLYNVDRLRRERGLKVVEVKRTIVNGKRRVIAKEVK